MVEDVNEFVVECYYIPEKWQAGSKKTTDSMEIVRESSHAYSTVVIGHTFFRTRLAGPHTASPPRSSSRRHVNLLRLIHAARQLDAEGMFGLSP